MSPTECNLAKNLTKRRHRGNDVPCIADGKHKSRFKSHASCCPTDFSLNFSHLFNRFIDRRAGDRYRHGRSVQLHLFEHPPLTTGIPGIHDADRQQRKSETESPPANSIYTFATGFSRTKIPLSEIFIGGWPGRSRESTQFVGNSSENLVNAEFSYPGGHGENCYKLLLVILTPRSFSASWNVLMGNSGVVITN